MTRTDTFLAVLVIVLLSAPVAWDFYRDSRTASACERASYGDAEQSIIQQLGQPNQVEPHPGGKTAFYSYFPLSRWAFSYSENGKLDSCFHLMSE